MKKRYRDAEEIADTNFYLQYIVSLYRKILMDTGEEGSDLFTIKELGTMGKHPEKIMAHELYHMMKFIEDHGMKVPETW